MKDEESDNRNDVKEVQLSKNLKILQIQELFYQFSLKNGSRLFCIKIDVL